MVGHHGVIIVFVQNPADLVQKDDQEVVQIHPRNMEEVHVQVVDLKMQVVTMASVQVNITILSIIHIIVRQK